MVTIFFCYREELMADLHRLGFRVKTMGNELALAALMLREEYQVKPAFPFVPGGEVGGEVLEVGASVDGRWSTPSRDVSQAAGFLREEAEDLYWNELEWEHITDEEALEEGPLTTLTFPGFLAYVRGLLLREVMQTYK